MNVRGGQLVKVIIESLEGRFEVEFLSAAFKRLSCLRVDFFRLQRKVGA